MSFIVDARIRNANDVAIAADGSFAIVANYDGDNNVARIELMQKKRPKNARKFAAAAKGKKKRGAAGGGAAAASTTDNAAEVDKATDSAGGGDDGGGGGIGGIQLAAEIAKVKIDGKE